jgi:hypothetical protein
LKGEKMNKIVIIIASIIIGLHGLIHLMGTVVYMKLGTIEGLAYKTTVLGGRWDLGENGMMVFGALWAVAAVGFVLAAVALLAGWGWWRPMLMGVALLSLVLTTLDWNDAFRGAIVNMGILLVLWLGPRITGWTP